MHSVNTPQWENFRFGTVDELYPGSNASEGRPTWGWRAEFGGQSYGAWVFIDDALMAAEDLEPMFREQAAETLCALVEDGYVPADPA